ncbi:MAG: hypothetical protein N0A00_10100 [Candidatus Bathyarchaeota archaeon]|nr:hypothetical protein [Candidatus Bathyarchaeota archaeon]
MSGTVTVEENSSCVTYTNSGGRSSKHRNKTLTVSIRLPVWLYEELKAKGTSNISGFIRTLLARQLNVGSSEEERLEAELNELEAEMEKLQKYHSTLLKHGSYAQDYLEKLKDGNIVTHNPFKYSKPGQIPLSREEQKLVEETIKLREELSKVYAEKLRKLLELKRKNWRGENFGE